MNLFDKGELLELQQQGAIGIADGSGVNVPATAVVTGIVGGEREAFGENGEGDGLPTQEARGGIVRTVRMEQTYI